MNLGSVKGFLGELVVMEMLEKENIKFTPKGNQSGIDIELENGVKIDVKLSLLKHELKKLPKNYGWALTKNIDKIACTHYVCVALNEDLSIKNFYIFKSADIKKFKKSPLSQFKNVINAFMILEDPKSLDSLKVIKPDMYEFYKQCYSLIDTGIVTKLDAGQKIGKYLTL